MQRSDTPLVRLRHAQLAPYTFSAVPAWVWAIDGVRVMWCNAAGAAAFGETRIASLMGHRFEPHDLAVREVQRLRGSLPISGAVQLVRLRGFANALAGILTCAASRIALPGLSSAILIVGTEPARPALPLAERARRMLAEIDDAAGFAPDGTLLHAGEAVRGRIGPDATLASLAGPAAAADVLARGSAEASSVLGPIRLEKLGGGDAVVVVALPRQPAAAANPDAPAAAAQDAPAAGADRIVAPDSIAPDGVMLDDMELRLVMRRHPLRFVWRMDADARFTIESGDFTALAGAPTARNLGKPWTEIAAALGLDPPDSILRAIASRDTWSGLTVEWPVEGTPTRLPVTLSGLPSLTRDHGFAGYRGFGVCRDVPAIRATIAARRAVRPHAAEPAAKPEAPDIAEPPAPAPHGINIVPLRTGTVLPPDRRPALSPIERNAFQEIARALGARFEPDEAAPLDPSHGEPFPTAHGLPELAALERDVLARLPVGILVYRGDALLFANRAFLEQTRYADTASLAAAGGVAALFGGPETEPISDEDGRELHLRAADGSVLAADVRLVRLPMLQGMMLVLTGRGTDATARPATPAAIEIEADIAAMEAERAALARDVEAAVAEAHELRAVLDTATDGVMIVDAEARILSCNLSAEALFGYDRNDLVGRALADLFAPESQRVAIDYLATLQRGSLAGLLNDGREMVGRVRQGGLITLFMTIGRIAEQPAKFCAVFRDLTQWKSAEEELRTARRTAGEAVAAKSDILGRLNHELRAPLNTIVGFAELMMRERLGPLGDERYRTYLGDMHASATQLLALLNDLLDLSKIESGRLALTFTQVDLNEIVQQGVAAMQPQANSERIIIRTALLPSLRRVVADAASLRQIVQNLLSNSIKFTGAGGQVIVSTAATEAGEAAIRIRDTGVGMSEQQIAAALEPFRRLHVGAPGMGGGPGIGLPLTKALTEANRARFQIKSEIGAGTLVEIVFPATRVVGQ